MRTFALSTGSKGNCFYIENRYKNLKCLVDFGLSYKRAKEILLKKNIDINDINCVFITHEHNDHISGLEILLKKSSCVIYMSKGTFEKLPFLQNYLNRIKFVKEKDFFKLNSLEVFVLRSHHDAQEPVSFVFLENKKRIGFFTDMGEIDIISREQIKSCDIVYLEANYCEDFLKKNFSKFSLSYINRLFSNRGHLGVNQVLMDLNNLVKENQKIILSHISENTNSYFNTYKKFKEKIKFLNFNVELIVSFQGEPTKWIE